MKGEVEISNRQNIIDMAFTFSAMTRVFGKGSDRKIEAVILDSLDGIAAVKSKKEFDRKHEEFCSWFTDNIMTAKKVKGGRTVKESKNASWGQAAKVLDVVLHVCIFYCKLPSAEISAKITPWLNSAVDNTMMRYLKKQYHDPSLSGVNSIADIDHARYEALQRILREDIRKSFKGEISPVQWDDIMWRRGHDKRSRRPQIPPQAV